MSGRHDRARRLVGSQAVPQANRAELEATTVRPMPRWCRRLRGATAPQASRIGAMTQPAVGEGTKAEAAYIGGRGTVRGGDQSRGAALVQRDHRGRNGLIRTVRLVGTDFGRPASIMRWQRRCRPRSVNRVACGRVGGRRGCACTLSSRSPPWLACHGWSASARPVTLQGWCCFLIRIGCRHLLFP
jgi:hypothetical protein